ncbi:MAG: restriction endonuclease subunit S [Ignavibacteriae bacterium]|nr:restriction endonuclease subunit S [Ignavibacteriota bacterium]
MKRYEKYKTSDIDWIGEIPSHWEMSKAKYYFKYTTGFTPPSGQNEFYNGDLTWVTIADMNQKVISDSANTLSHLAIERYKPDVTKKDSLLFSFKLSVGKVAYAGKDLYTNEAIISILPDENYDVRYFFYALPEQLLKNANENIYGAKMLNQELIRNASICFPPKAEQTAIANFLDEKTSQIEKLISNKQKLIELLIEERTVSLNIALTKGINKKEKLKESNIEWFGLIPENWEIKKIGHLASVTKLTGFEYTGKWETVADGEIIALRGYNIGEGFLEISKVEKISKELSNELIRSKLYKNDIVYPCTGTIGNAALIEIDNQFHINQNVAKITPNQLIYPEFLLFAILSSSVKSQIHYNNASQMQPVILIGDLRQMKICLPFNIEEQIAIVQYVKGEIKRIGNLISKIEKEIELMNEYRTALISEAVTGKIKIT